MKNNPQPSVVFNKVQNISFTFPWLFILFGVLTTLKLVGVVTASWWTVTAPLWAPFAAIFAFFVLGFLVLLALAALCS